MTECITENEIIEKVQKEADDTIYREIKDPYGFIYITTNLINGKRYLGLKKFNEDWKKYLGSGTAFRRAIKKYKPENFQRNIIDIAYSEDELKKKEYEYSVFLNVVESDDWYNIVYGGGATLGWHPSEETKQKLRNANLGKIMPEEVKKKIAKTLSQTMTGRSFSDEHKQHIREARLGLKNPGYRPIYCVELDEIFWSAKAAEDKYGIDNGSICNCCRGYRQTRGKHPVSKIPLHWKYIDDFINKDGVVIKGAVSLGYVTAEDVAQYLDNLKEKGNDTNG